MVINAMIFTMVGDVFTTNQRLADPVPYEYYNGSWKKTEPLPSSTSVPP